MDQPAEWLEPESELEKKTRRDEKRLEKRRTVNNKRKEGQIERLQ